MNSTIKSFISKVNFDLGRNPRIPRSRKADYHRFIPEHYEAVFILSADFELAWAWRYAKNCNNPKEMAARSAEVARDNIPRILALCEKHNIPITWATVGHLLLERCNRIGGQAHFDLMRLPYHENENWRFDEGDWFDDDPCTNWQTSPAWYSPDLIRMILASKANHEIACHTFSHIDCRDNICPFAIFQGEISACKALAREYQIELKSFVHPGHSIGNLQALKDLGFSSFRTNYANLLGYPSRHSNGLWEFGATAELVHRKEWSLDYHINRYTKIVERAMKYHRLCYYWFHPSMEPTFVDSVMPAIFEYADSKRKSIWVTTMKDYTSWLESVRDEKS